MKDKKPKKQRDACICICSKCREQFPDKHMLGRRCPACDVGTLVDRDEDARQRDRFAQKPKGHGWNPK